MPPRTITRWFITIPRRRTITGRAFPGAGDVKATSGSKELRKRENQRKRETDFR
jgi:hypothetical protein